MGRWPLFGRDKMNSVGTGQNLGESYFDEVRPIESGLAKLLTRDLVTKDHSPLNPLIPYWAGIGPWDPEIMESPPI